MSSTSDDTDIYSDITEQQKLILAIAPRISASISAVCALYMMITILKSPYCRGRTYHRIMCGNTVPILILNAATLWGPAAAPEGTDHVLGARGTTATCTVQGFLYQFKLVNSAYYAILSILTWRLVNNKNRQQLSMYYELCIHIGMYIFPVATGIYFITIDAFNMLTLGCGVASVPFGCGDQSPVDGPYVECTRGPQNIGQIQWFLVGVPAAVVAAGPAILILSLFCKILCCSSSSSSSTAAGTRRRRRSGNNIINNNNSNNNNNNKANTATRIALSVAKQGAIYLAPLYLSYLFRWYDAYQVVGKQQYVFKTNLLAEIFEPLNGVWTLLVYNYFRSNKTKVGSHPFTTTTTMTKNDKKNVTVDDDDRSIVFDYGDNNNNNNHYNGDEEEGGGEYSSSGRSGGRDLVGASRFFGPSFSIFDGTNVSNSDSPWAAFLHDEGEDDSYNQGGDDDEYSDGDFQPQQQQTIQKKSPIISVPDKSTTTFRVEDEDHDCPSF